MMKFSEVDKETLYADLATRGINVSADLQQTISDWFDLREVVDDDNFPTFFKRIMCEDYFRYIQLLRIEPNVSQYDWLVTKYRERLNQRVGNTTTSEEKSDNLSHGLVITADRTDVRTPNLTNTSNKSNTGTDNVSITDTGTVDHEKTTTYNETNTAKTGNATVNTGVSKALPASSGTNNDITTSSVTTPSGNTFNVNKPAVAYATAEDQTISQGFTDADARHTGTVSDDGTETRDLAGTNNRTLNLAETGTDSLSGTDRSTSQNDIEHSGVDERSIEGNGTKNEDITDTEIYTGRDESPQELLTKASAYIKNTCAWEWLRKQLEPCFMSIYEL